MADTQVPDNHDKAHEVMNETDAVERGQALAEQNNAAEQKRREELEAEADKGVKPAEGDVPENNEDNGKDSGPNRGDLSDTRSTSNSTGTKGVRSSSKK